MCVQDAAQPAVRVDPREAAVALDRLHHRRRVADYVFRETAAAADRARRRIRGRQIRHSRPGGLATERVHRRLNRPGKLLQQRVEELALRHRDDGVLGHVEQLRSPAKRIGHIQNDDTRVAKLRIGGRNTARIRPPG